MITVLFFGRIREELDCPQLALEYLEDCSDLDALQQRLGILHGDRWAAILGQDNVIRAVNQVIVTANVALDDGDEVAFFPPVTGG